MSEGARNRVALSKRYRFESAHLLPLLPDGHKCRRLHGHSFEVEVEVRGPLDPRLGWLVDYAEISRVVKPVVEELDHRYLNEIEGLDNPTSEVLAIWFWERLAGRIDGIYRVTIFETCTTRCDYFGPEGC
ncbi:MAG: 6-carboxytetrahydropterin synthase QueD [Candidatus Eisenbacteria bacterium]